VKCIAVVDPKRFMEAVWAGDLASVEAMLAAGADPNDADGDPWPPLHLAIEQRWVEITRRLIAAGADLNRELGDGWTPLAHAIDIESDAASQAGLPPEEVSTEFVELLLASGASQPSGLTSWPTAT
jgi:ankyrin repeat protein